MMAVSLVILLHGVGSRGADMAPLADHLAPLLPDAGFEAPDAPQPFDQGGPGRQWFSISGVTEANRAGRIAAARPAFDAVLSALIDRHGLSGHPECVALMGFSQGTIMALDAVASGRWQFGAVVGFSGRLATPDPLAPSPRTSVLLLHGTADPVIPAAEAQSAHERLSTAGADISLSLLPGLGHSINREGLDLAAAHLARLP
jgi:phospholipase/carboxylesterase